VPEPHIGSASGTLALRPIVAASTQLKWRRPGFSFKGLRLLQSIAALVAGYGQTGQLPAVPQRYRQCHIDT